MKKLYSGRMNKELHKRILEDAIRGDRSFSRTLEIIAREHYAEGWQKRADGLRADGYGTQALEIEESIKAISEG